MSLPLFVFAGSFAWLIILLLPWRPWSTRERLETGGNPPPLPPVSGITVLIPARNEAEEIGQTLAPLIADALKIILVDDQSTDGTTEIVRRFDYPALLIVQGKSLPPGWTGKLWALEQGLQRVTTEFVLLLDADIEVSPGMVRLLEQKFNRDQLDLVSIMAELRMETFWEKMLVPAFVFFFKLLYPFSIGNNPKSRLGVAAGGCILVRTQILRDIGGFEALQSAIIDDCTLARKIKMAGGRTWVGLSHGVRSHRAYSELKTFWNMVARTAYTQLGYSPLMLVATSIVMILMFWLPVIGLLSPASRGFAIAGMVAMALAYLPTLAYYRRSRWRVLTLPLVGTLFLAMTWSSAWRYCQGKRSEWKGRTYARSPEHPPVP